MLQTINSLTSLSSMPPQHIQQLSTHQPSRPPHKRVRLSDPELPEELGKYIDRDVKLLHELGWDNLVKHRRQRGDINPTPQPHPAQHTLQQYRKNGVPVRFSTEPWSPAQLQNAIRRGAHPSCSQHIDFLEKEFISMIQKGQCCIHHHKYHIP